MNKTQSADIDEVLRTFDGLYVTACERRDPAAVLDQFVDDEEISFAGSGLAERTTTKDGLRAIAQEIADSPATLRFQWQEKRARIEGDVAWVNAVGTVSVVEGEIRTTVPYRATGIFLKRSGRWLWQTHAGSEPR